jgi:hypothetical protein
MGDLSVNVQVGDDYESCFLPVCGRGWSEEGEGSRNVAVFCFDFGFVCRAVQTRCRVSLLDSSDQYCGDGGGMKGVGVFARSSCMERRLASRSGSAIEDRDPEGVQDWTDTWKGWACELSWGEPKYPAMRLEAKK